jgi:hypothetical protein
MVAEKRRDLFVALESRLVDVEVHAVDAFDFQLHMTTDDIGDAAR